MAAAVVIGRNEGARLVRCLRAALQACAPVVYVDSGSEDGSVEAARELGVEVVELDPQRPFSAARARNEGVARLRSLDPGAAFVQLVDGDCELVPGWVELAERVLDEVPRCAVVCGRRRERHPEASIYNRLCDLEWDTPVGRTDSCGGDALIRIEAFEEVGGFRDEVIAGEEPELCLRLRRAGFRIQRIDAEMTLHDAAIERFGAWWKRVRRGGHAAAEGWWRHRGDPERFMARRVASALLWGAAAPGAALLAAPWTGGGSLVALLALLGAQGLRISGARRRAGRSRADARLEAVFLLVGKPAEAAGVLQFLMRRLLRRAPRVIEYKKG